MTDAIEKEMAAIGARMTATEVRQSEALIYTGTWSFEVPISFVVEPEPPFKLVREHIDPTTVSNYEVFYFDLSTAPARPYIIKRVPIVDNPDPDVMAITRGMFR